MRRAATLRRMRTEEPHGILDDRPPRPGARPFLENWIARYRVVESRHKALLSFLAIRGESKRKQVKSIHIFVKDSAKIGTGGVRRGLDDVPCLGHGYLRLSLIRRLTSVEIDNQVSFLRFLAFHLLF